MNEIKYFSTLSSEYQPKAISNISISNYSRKNDTLVADISWNISENGNKHLVHLVNSVVNWNCFSLETVCNYQILYYETIENPFKKDFLWTDELNDVRLFAFNIYSCFLSYNFISRQNN